MAAERDSSKRPAAITHRVLGRLHQRVAAALCGNPLIAQLLEQPVAFS